MADILDNLIKVDRHNARAAVNALVRAFYNYPDLVYFFPNDNARKHLAYYFLSMAVFGGVRYGDVYATPGMEGVAVWLRSEQYPLTVWKILRSVPLADILHFIRYGGGKMQRLGEHLDSVHKRLAPFEHWYLATLGVDPRFKGQGVASRLLKPMLKRVDREGLPCYLETGDARNLPLYGHFGFKVIEESSIPQTPLTNWAMLREVPRDR
ncbi:MAG: GNAT family N-acetyltransferase [Dehalococcoidales bacterium]|nr:GNAT family N-acetyltransferase [Dehalococcoidales bacterium]